MKYLQPTVGSLGLHLFQGISIVIDFKKLEILELYLLNSDVQKVFVIPDWLCAAWYKSINGIFKKLKISSAKLPANQTFSWTNYISAARRFC